MITYAGIPHPPGRAATFSLQDSEVDDGTHSYRLNSSHLRELTRGKFIIKFQEITLLESIGQGIRMHVYLYGVDIVCVHIENITIIDYT